MSGPKIDSAELERRKRIALEQARLEKLNKIRLATNKLNEERQQVERLRCAIRQDHAEQLADARSRTELSMTVQTVDAKKKGYTALLQELMQRPVPSEPQEIQALASSTRETAAAFFAEYQRTVDSEWIRLQAHFEAEAALYDQEQFSALLDTGCGEDATAFISFSFETEEIKHSEAIAASVKTRAYQIMKEITSLVNSAGISHADRQTVVDFARHIQVAAQQGEVPLNTAIMEYQMAKGSILARTEEFNELYQQYMAQYIAHMGIINAERTEKLELQPKPMNKFAAVQELKQEIADLDALSTQVNEQNYIRAQLNEVMQMFDFDLCKDIILNHEHRGHHYLCQSKNGNTAVHVHISDKQQIMMEIVGAETVYAPREDGISAVVSDATAVSDWETEILLEEQGRFCSIHPQITEELKKRGVLLKTKVHREPNKKYSKKITRYISEEYADEAVKTKNAGSAQPRAARQKSGKPKELEMK